MLCYTPALALQRHRVLYVHLNPTHLILFFSFHNSILDTELYPVRQLNLNNYSEHNTLGQLANGEDMHFSVSFGASPQQCTDHSDGIGTLIKSNPITGQCETLIGPSTGWQYPPSGSHPSSISQQRPGWITISSVGETNPSHQEALDNEIVLFDANANIYCRLAHHHSYGKNGSQGYWAEPHASMSPLGTRIIFASDWHNSGSVDTYVIELQ